MHETNVNAGFRKLENVLHHPLPKFIVQDFFMIFFLESCSCGLKGYRREI
jgi:hypothetical protein